MFKYVLLIIIFIFLILLFAPIKLRVYYYKENLSLEIRYLLFKFDPLKMMDKHGKKKRKEEKVTKETKQTVHRSFIKRTKDTLRKIDEFLSPAKAAFKLLRRKMKFDKLLFRLDFSTGDAADTAFLYGILCGIVFPFFGLFGCYFNVADQQIYVNPVFKDEAVYELKFECLICLNLAIILFAGIIFALRYVKLKLNNKKTKPVIN